MGKQVDIITNLAPHYRIQLWQWILKNKKYDFHFLFGQENESGIEKIDFNQNSLRQYKSRTVILKNRYFKKKFLIWQSGVISRALKSDVAAVIITGDSWVVSNWVIALIYRLRDIKVVFWSHGLYGNEKGLKKILRLCFYKLANNHLLYERRAKKLMTEKGFNNNDLHVIFNSLDYEKSVSYRAHIQKLNKDEILDFFSNPENPTLFFVGRLTRVKKLHLLVEAFKSLRAKGLGLNLLIVGDGPIKNELEKTLEPEQPSKTHYFYGPCYSEDKLAELISCTDLCVSPGNVGLTAVHSLSYGTPVITHDNFVNQMPEAGAIKSGFNGLFFEEDNVESLVNQIENWLFQQKASRNEIRENCYEVIDDYYNPEYQVKVIENLLDGKPPLV
jgi:glycosyltransferase involved in cell wall biosynthesis